MPESNLQIPRMELGGRHAGKRGGQLRTHGDIPFAFVLETEKLSDNFVAALFPVKVGGFENGTFVFHEAIASGDLPPNVEDIIPRSAFLGAVWWACRAIELGTARIGQRT